MMRQCEVDLSARQSMQAIDITVARHYRLITCCKVQKQWLPFTNLAYRYSMPLRKFIMDKHIYIYSHGFEMLSENTRGYFDCAEFELFNKTKK